MFKSGETQYCCTCLSSTTAELQTGPDRSKGPPYILCPLTFTWIQHILRDVVGVEKRQTRV